MSGIVNLQQLYYSHLKKIGRCIFSFADWMEEKCEKAKSVQSGLLLSTHELSEEEKATTEGLSGIVNLQQQFFHLKKKFGRST